LVRNLSGKRTLWLAIVAAQIVGTMTVAAENPDTKPLVQKIHRLADLRALAQKQLDTQNSARDVYTIQNELAASYARQGLPYLWSMPTRSPPSPCSTREHTVPRIKLKIVFPHSHHQSPGDGEELVFWALDLHEIEVHGRALTSEQLSFLTRLP